MPGLMSQLLEPILRQNITKHIYFPIYIFCACSVFKRKANFILLSCIGSMGQTQQFKTSSVSELKPTTDYQTDLRILPVSADDSALVPSPSQEMVRQVIQIANSIPEHPFEKYIISEFDTRFHSTNTFVGRAAISQKRPTVKPHSQKPQFKQWFELSSKEQFLKIFTSLKKHFAIQKQLQQLHQSASTHFKDYIPSNQSVKDASLCRKMGGLMTLSEISLDESLIARLFYVYYIKMLKRNGANASKVSNFHHNTGHRLCLLISYEQIKLQQLFQLLYFLVYIDKHEALSDGKLNLIHDRYNELCLAKYYSTNVNKRRYEVMRTATRLYLDQLYMTSIKQAEDPDILAQNDCLLPTRTFPIQRVKTKNKNV